MAGLTARTGVPGGRWWRFTDYEIRDGFIRPTRRAELAEFDPWAAFWKRGRSRVATPPYLQLVNIVQAIEVRENGEVPFDRDVEARLLTWCQRFGLLGLLPQMTTFAVEEWRGRTAGRTYFAREGDRWSSWAMVDDEASEPGSVSGQRRSEAVVEPFMGRATVVPLDEAWGPFFPNEDAERDWGTGYDHAPTPLSEEFWFRYAEPLPYFVNASQLLGRALPGTNRRGRSSATTASLELLSSLARGSGPAVERKPRARHQLRWRSPALISTLAVMAMQDLTREKGVYQCPCGNRVTSTDTKTKYCSAEHREKYRKRDYRARNDRR